MHIYRHKPARKFMLKAQKLEGFTLLELLIVIVILGVLGAVGVPAYFNQVDITRENAANQAVMAAAKACSALRITGDHDDFEEVSGVDETTCSGPGTIQLFTSNLGDLDPEAQATVSAGGGVQLTRPAAR
jgi:prepilin-type N-terminal cleavage/methylation domain-containing protein